jgi:hypothetical protein
MRLVQQLPYLRRKLRSQVMPRKRRELPDRPLPRMRPIAEPARIIRVPHKPRRHRTRQIAHRQRPVPRHIPVHRRKQNGMPSPRPIVPAQAGVVPRILMIHRRHRKVRQPTRRMPRQQRPIVAPKRPAAIPPLPRIVIRRISHRNPRRNRRNQQRRRPKRSMRLQPEPVLQRKRSHRSRRIRQNRRRHMIHLRPYHPRTTHTERNNSSQNNQNFTHSGRSLSLSFVVRNAPRSGLHTASKSTTNVRAINSTMSAQLKMTLI